MALRPPLKQTLKPGEKVMRPIHPNVGIRVRYRDELTKLIEQMHRDVLKAVTGTYDDNPPLTVMAEDRLGPIAALKKLMSDLRRRWLARFDAMAPRLAEWHTTAVKDRVDGTMKKILRDGGISVRFQASKRVREVMASSVGENVSLIKTIPQQYFARVEQAVMRSASVGGDVGALTRELSTGFGITTRRAEFIARDQTTKMTAIVVRERQLELGVKEAIWQHSHGGHEPRPTHVAFDGKRFDVSKGAWLEDVGGKMAWVWPGTPINCRCTCKAIIPGINDK